MDEPQADPPERPAPMNPPEVLPYAAPSPQASGGQVLLRTFLMLFGFFVGAGVVALLGGIIFDSVGYSIEKEIGQRVLWPVIFFGVLLLAVVAGMVALIRRHRRTGQFFIMGLLLGAAGMSLIEGICFMHP